MTARFHDWVRPEGECSGGPRPGTINTLAALIHTFDETSSLGIYNCRTVRGSTSPSVHGEGRALDLAIPVGSDGRGTTYGHDIVERIISVAWELGATFMVYDRTAFSASAPAGRTYGGVHPHYDHIHLEQTRQHAEFLTYATVKSLLGDTVTRTYDQAIVGYSQTDIDMGLIPARGYGLARVRIDDDGNLHSVTHPGERAEIGSWAGVVGLKAAQLYGSRTPKSVLAGGDREATGDKIFAFIRKHNPTTWRRRGIPF